MEEKVLNEYSPVIKNGREVVLEVDGIDITFGSGKHVFKAVSNASFDIYKGETFSLVGESFEEKYNNICEVLRWLIYVSVAIWIVIKVIVVYYKRNLQRAKNKIYDIVDEV